MKAEEAVWINRKFFFFLSGIFLLLLISTGYLSYRQFFVAEQKGSVQGAKIAGTKDLSKLDEDELLKAVEKMVLLPPERPTFASISDTEKLKGKELFANAKAGDIVMIFQKAQKIIIFRPSTSQIVEVAKIDLRTAQITIAPTSSPTPTTPEPTPTIYSIAPTSAQSASGSGSL